MDDGIEAILHGKVGVAEVEASLRRCPLVTGRVVSAPLNEDHDIVRAYMVDGTSHIFHVRRPGDGPIEGVDVPADQTTLVSKSVSADAVPLVEAVLSAFGGFIKERPGREWRRVGRGPELGTTPIEKLAAALHGLAYPEHVQAVLNLVRDTEKATAFKAALDEYVEATAEPTNAPGM